MYITNQSYLFLLFFKDTQNALFPYKSLNGTFT